LNKLVEAAAKGMAFDQDGAGTWPYDWDIADQDQYRNLAQAALATFREWLEQNGLVVVPRKATENMLAHASLVEVDDIELTPSEYRAAWRAMIAGAPATGLE
jgi:hypothetical protein